jgi:hypothetical protein
LTSNNWDLTSDNGIIMGMMEVFFFWEYHWIKGWQQFRMLNNGFPDLDQGDKKGNALIDFSFTNP